MRTNQYFLATLEQTPSDTKVISHQLMIRAGIIRKVASGLYSWLPTGVRVLHKINNIVREEMDKVGAIEITMTLMQPAELWKKSKRWVEYGQELLRFKDRSGKHFVISPTHEEIIINLIRKEISSYRQLPRSFYQIQTKFRDEIRPRFGVMRSREFLMKDAYSFHSSQYSLQQTYNAMHQAYHTIFTRLGLHFRVIRAHTGVMGGNESHEFQVLTDNGEDNIVFSTESNYAENIECAEAINPMNIRLAPCEDIRLVDTPNVCTIFELSNQFHLSLQKIVKILLVRANKNIGHSLIALAIRGDHQLNHVKAERLEQVFSPLTFANEEDAQSSIGTNLASLGPLNLPIPLIIDRSVAVMSDFVSGANITGKHFFGINWKRDLPIPRIADLRNVVEGDISPDRKGYVHIRRGIEVAHMFQLGTKYSKSMQAFVQNENGRTIPIVMGCYGIGITRLVAAIIEQNHDRYGIVWPENLAPFSVAILPINIHTSLHVRQESENLYQRLRMKGIDVLFDDRKERPGVMFSDMELIGIPHQLVISDRNLQKKEIEYKNRRSGKKQLIKLNEAVDFLVTKSISSNPL